MIPVSNPHASYLAHKEEIDTAIYDVLDGRQYIGGDFVRWFENEFATYIGVNYAIGVASGTDALSMILRALGIGKGHEVITVSFTNTGTVAPIVLNGAKPRFVDIDLDTMTMEHLGIEKAINEKTRAILPVHLYGQLAYIEILKDIAEMHGLHLIEDACQAHGARDATGKKAGSFGVAGAFSFYPTKNLGALGDGGCITTDNAFLAEELRRMRFYGWNESGNTHIICGQSRLDALQAAILSVKLRYLDHDNAVRRNIANYYTEMIGGGGNVGNELYPEVKTPRHKQEEHVYHQYVIRHVCRDKIANILRVKGIGTAQHYHIPVAEQSAYVRYTADTDCLHATRKATQEILSLPIWPEMTDAEIEIVAKETVNAIKRYQ
jgi:dTDP-4-amino-4,6-dideoxygalactose transaminase